MLSPQDILNSTLPERNNFEVVAAARSDQNYRPAVSDGQGRRAKTTFLFSGGHGAAMDACCTENNSPPDESNMRKGTVDPTLPKLSVVQCRTHMVPFYCVRLPTGISRPSPRAVKASVFSVGTLYTSTSALVAPLFVLFPTRNTRSHRLASSRTLRRTSGFVCLRTLPFSALTPPPKRECGSILHLSESKSRLGLQCPREGSGVVPCGTFPEHEIYLRLVLSPLQVLGNGDKRLRGIVGVTLLVTRSEHRLATSYRSSSSKRVHCIPLSWTENRLWDHLQVWFRHSLRMHGVQRSNPLVAIMLQPKDGRNSTMSLTTVGQSWPHAASPGPSAEQNGRGQDAPMVQTL